MRGYRDRVTWVMGLPLGDLGWEGIWSDGYFRQLILTEGMGGVQMLRKGSCEVSARIRVHGRCLLKSLNELIQLKLG